MDIKVAEVMEYLVSGRSKDGYSSVSECVEHMSSVINTFEDCLNPTTIIAEHKEEEGIISINASEGKDLFSLDGYSDCCVDRTELAHVHSSLECKGNDWIITERHSFGPVARSLDNKSIYTFENDEFYPDVCGFYDVREELKHNFIQHIVSDITFENAVIDAIDNFNKLGLTFCVICIKDVFYIVSPDFEAVSAIVEDKNEGYCFAWVYLSEKLINKRCCLYKSEVTLDELVLGSIIDNGNYIIKVDDEVKRRLQTLTVDLITGKTYITDSTRYLEPYYPTTNRKENGREEPMVEITLKSKCYMHFRLSKIVACAAFGFDLGRHLNKLNRSVDHLNGDYGSIWGNRSGNLQLVTPGVNTKLIKIRKNFYNFVKDVAIDHIENKVKTFKTSYGTRTNPKSGTLSLYPAIIFTTLD